MPIQRIPLVGSLTNRNHTPDASKDQQFVNCYPEIVTNPLTRKVTAYTYKRPGSTKSSNALTGVSTAGVSGAFVAWTGHSDAVPLPVAAFVNADTTVSVWRLDTDAKLGSDISGVQTCTALTETMVSSTANLVGNFANVVSGALEQWYFPEGGAWTEVTDSDFPANVVGFPVHMDGYVFNMTATGRIYNSDLNSVSAYTAGNFITASQYPDRGVTVAKLGPHIIAFGESSIERFYNNGNTVGSPLSRVQDGGLTMGAARRSVGSLQTVHQAFETIYWVGTNSQGGVTGVYRFKGGAPEKISTPAIDKMVAAGTLSGFAGTLHLHGGRHVLMRGTSGTFAYAVDTGFWWKLVLASGEITASLALSTTVSPANVVTYFIGTNNARGNQFSGSVNQDDGSNFTMTVQTANDDLGTTKRKSFRSLRLVGDDPAAASNVGVAWSDDDYANFTTARNIDLNTYPSPALRNLGMSRRRAWKLTNTANTTLRLEALELEYEVTPWS